MKLKLVSFELAKKLKILGFTGFYNTTDYIKVYNNGYSFKDVGQLTEVKGEDEVGVNYYCLAPTLELARMWFRKEYKLNIEIKVNMVGCEVSHNILESFFITIKQVHKSYNVPKITFYYKTYEEALEKALLEACKLIKK